MIRAYRFSGAGNMQAYLSAGSNLGNRSEYLEFALSCLRQSQAGPTRRSPLYETEPLGFREQPWFLNLAVEVETNLEPSELLQLCRRIEEAAGRVRDFKWSPRTLDLDILLYGDQIVHKADLTVPHPRMAERRFVLQPLADIAPDLVHPVLKKPIRLLLALCPDTSAVRRFPLENPPDELVHRN